MGMWTTANQDEIQAKLDKFAQDTYDLYGSHSFAMGYLMSMIVDMLAQMPKTKQKQTMADMDRVLARIALQMEKSDVA